MKQFNCIGAAFHSRPGAYVFYALTALAFWLIRSAGQIHGWIPEVYPQAFIPALTAVILVCAAVHLAWLLFWGKVKRPVLRGVHMGFCVLSGIFFVYAAVFAFSLDKGFVAAEINKALAQLFTSMALLLITVLLPVPFAIFSNPKKVIISASCITLAICFGGACVYVSQKIKTESGLAKSAWHLKPLPENAELMASILPSQRQITHAKETEFYAFFHFGINTFAGVEWGDGKEDPMIFDPAALDTDQWIKAIADAGMTGAIITAKHHDGFCLWPSEYTDFSVKNSPYRGDIVKEFAESCRKYGVKFGFYLSPWDMNSPLFGQDEAYNDHYVNQLTELLTNYGEVFEVWFDGAIADAYKGIQTYDWDRWVSIVRELQPGAVTAIAPPVPDVAWVGNEDGLANGNVNSVRYRSGQWIWARSECDVSIRHGWFYHDHEGPKSLDHLMRIYYNSIGMNCTLLLNIPPNREGRLDQKDVDRLAEMGRAVEAVYANEIPAEMTVLREGRNTFAYDFKLDAPQKARHVILSEDVSRFGERITSWSVYAKVGGLYSKVGEAESAGAKTIVRLSRFAPKTDSYRIVIEEARANPALNKITFYG